MWLLPSQLSASFQEAAGSISELTSPFDNALAFLWRGERFFEVTPWAAPGDTPWQDLSPTSKRKPSRPPSFSRVWKKASWLRALCGRTSPPSTDARFVDWWTSCLAEARAKTSPSPVSARASMAPAADSSGTSSASSKSASPPLSSGKTSAVQFLLFPESSTPSQPSATEGPPSPFVLLTWERPTAASASSCWPTATAMDSRSSGAAGYSTDSGRHSGTTLLDAARQWPTPTTSLGTKGVRSEAGAIREAARTRGPDLAAKVAVWPTPATRDFKGANGPEHLAKTRGHHDQLPNAVALSGLPALATSTDGETTSRPVGPLRLSADFVEALMGWPVGHSIPFGLTDSDSSETVSSPPRPLRPSASSPNASEVDDDA